jgi:hypothetical protein
MLSKVYGMLVADDIFGDLYMVPLDDIMADIRDELNTCEVALPFDRVPTATESRERSSWAEANWSGVTQFDARSEDVTERADVDTNKEPR